MVNVAGLLFAMLPQAGNDPTYQTIPLRDLVRQVALHNRDVPADLAAYAGRVETEVGLLQVDATGSERVFRVEQVALRVRWERDGNYREHVIGHRAQSSGLLRFEALRLRSFTVPVLYGNRFDLLLGPYRPRDSIENVPAVQDALHPLAEGRERIYRYTRGDTVSTLKVGERTISIVRIHVEPVNMPALVTTVFQGDLFVNPDQSVLVGMRGAILEVGGTSSAVKRLASKLVRNVGYLEVFSAEVEGRYWVPDIERIEFRIDSPLVSREQVSLRFSSRFFDILPEARRVRVAQGDTVAVRPRRMTMASTDSLARFGQWRAPLGEQTSRDDFGELAGPGERSFRDQDRSRMRFDTQSWKQAIRFNRIEGLFTGLGVTSGSPAWAPRTTLMINGGRAWSEAAWRGEFRLEQVGDQGSMGISGGRFLESTNDFAFQAEQRSLLSALFLSRDDQDYLDRQKVSVFAERSWRRVDARMRVEVARVIDDSVTRHVQFGLVHLDSGFRVNRPISRWNGMTGTLAFEFHPKVLTEGVTPGIGAAVRLEHGTGMRQYTRLEARATMRRHIGDLLLLGARIDGGRVFTQDTPPLQQLFEIGGRVQLPGHDYKAMAGDQAVLARVEANYSLRKLLQSRGGTSLWRRIGFPQLSAALFTGAASSSTAGVRAAVQALELNAEPCGTTDTCDLGWQELASAQFGIRILDGGVFVGVRRQLFPQGRWRFTLAGTFF